MDSRSLSNCSPCGENRDSLESAKRKLDLPEYSEQLPRKSSFEESRVTEERHFYNIILHVVNQVSRENGLSEDKIGEAVTSIVNAFRFTIGHRFWEIDLSEADKRCGYLFRWGTVGAGMVRYMILKAVGHCEKLRMRMEKQHLQVVSLGGGAGNDVLGFFSALHQLDVEKKGDRVLDVTVVDAVEEWARCMHLMESLVRRGDYGRVSDLFQRNEVKMSFLQATVPGDIKDDCYNELHKADVVLMSRLISVLDFDVISKVTKKLYDTLSNDALVLFVDSPFRKEDWPNFQVLYISEEVSEKSPKDCYQLVESHKKFKSTDCVNSKARIAVLQRNLHSRL